MDDSINALISQLREFRDARDWEPFHTLKNLSASLAIEAAEIVELTQWKSEDEVRQLLNTSSFKSSLSNEIADVFSYLLLICDAANDPIEAAKRKIADNEARYPVEKAKGNAKKYTELKGGSE